MELVALPEISPLVEVGERTLVYEQRNALHPNICEGIIEQFERHDEDQFQGMIGQDNVIDLSIKNSTDALMRGQPHWAHYDKVLHQSLVKAVKLLPHQHHYQTHTVEDRGYQVQRTDEGGGYVWHYDGGGAVRDRILVAIWYLNTLEEDQGGTTDFLDQSISIRPEAGKLVLFPPYWTHYHRGAPVNYGQKYIATTWLVDV